MTNANSDVTGPVRLVLMPVTLRVMVTAYVPRAKLLVMCNAAIQNADVNAMSPALLVQSRNVFRNALTARAQCPVRLLVIMYLAPSVAKRSLVVVINAQQCVERSVLPLAFVRSAQAIVSRKIQWISS